MPYLKVILTKATDKSNRMLRAKSMECISLVGMAVGKDKFRDDAKQVFVELFLCLGALSFGAHLLANACRSHLPQIPIFRGLCVCSTRSIRSFVDFLLILR